jgi:hypothetical protein
VILMRERDRALFENKNEPAQKATKKAIARSPERPSALTRAHVQEPFLICGTTRHNPAWNTGFSYLASRAAVRLLSFGSNDLSHPSEPGLARAGAFAQAEIAGLTNLTRDELLGKC